MTGNFGETAIKEYCKQCVFHSNLKGVQKERLKSAVDTAENMEEFIATGIVGLLGIHG